MSNPCPSSDEAERVYNQLVRAHHDPDFGYLACPSPEGVCEVCRPYVETIDRLADECEVRGCTLERCIFEKRGNDSAA